jgi:hypothetical protein
MQVRFNNTILISCAVRQMFKFGIYSSVLSKQHWRTEFATCASLWCLQTDSRTKQRIWQHEVMMLQEWYHTNTTQQKALLKWYKIEDYQLRLFPRICSSIQNDCSGMLEGTWTHVLWRWALQSNTESGYETAPVLIQSWRRHLFICGQKEKQRRRFTHPLGLAWVKTWTGQ